MSSTYHKIENIANITQSCSNTSNNISKEKVSESDPSKGTLDYLPDGLCQLESGSPITTSEKWLAAVDHHEEHQEK